MTPSPPRTASKKSVLLLLCLHILIVRAAAHNSNPLWYQRYPAYPPYCSTPQEMATRTIPKLKPNVHVGETRLVHVTAIIRHGARTPWSGNMPCWEGYHDDEETGVWDCDLTTFLAPPSPRVINKEEEVPAGGGSDAMFLFEKKYDALQYPQHNILNGTCQRGQLLLQGYDQELSNGEFLRAAYVYDGSDMDHDINLRLLDLSDKTNRPYEEPLLRFRSDDDQRTLMSGQVLLRGLFGTEFVKHTEENGQQPIIPLHVADRRQDVLDMNGGECPRLTELKEIALSSKEFKAFNTSKETRTIRKFLEEELGNPNIGLDCLMTTICTDRKVPDALNDYQQERRSLHHTDDEDGDEEDHHAMYGPDLFERSAKLDISRENFPHLYNDAEFAKVGMGPMWAEIVDNIEEVVKENDRGLSKNKIAIFSGHDTTLMPLLATLGPRVWKLDEWPHYASMMLIEIHEYIDGGTDKSVFPSKFGFRLVYNGQVWTDRIDGCHEDHDLCDFGVFYDRVKSFAVRDRDCALQNPQKSQVVEHVEGLLQTSGGIMLLLSIVVLSVLIGAVATVMYLKQRMVFVGGVVFGDDNDGLVKGRQPAYRDINGSNNDEVGEASLVI